MRYIIAIVPIIFGLLALIGWAFDIEAFRRFGNASVSMNPITAICFILLSIELLRVKARAGYQGAAYFVRLGILIVMALGYMKLSDLLFGTSFRIDVSLYESRLNAELPKPNRMAPNTALNLFILSWALLLASFRSKYLKLLSQILALGAGFVAMLALVGYTFSIHSFYGIGVFTPMARNTAISFLLISIATLLSTANKGFMRFVVNDGPAGRMASFLLPAAIMIPVGVGWLRLVGQRQNLYDSEFGVALSVITNMVMLVILTFVTASLLYSTDLQRRKIEARLRAMASHDSLTGLVNRRVFLANLTRCIGLLKRDPARIFAVFYLDVDGLKQVNDNFGHEAGDDLLVHTATVLRGSSRSSDTVSRLGGDEFAILFEEINSKDDVNILAKRILENMPKCWNKEGEEIKTGISIGVMVITIPDITPERILSTSDSALNLAKSDGKNCYRLSA